MTTVTLVRYKRTVGRRNPGGAAARQIRLLKDTQATAEQALERLQKKMENVRNCSLHTRTSSATLYPEPPADGCIPVPASGFFDYDDSPTTDHISTPFWGCHRKVDRFCAGRIGRPCRRWLLQSAGLKRMFAEAHQDQLVTFTEREDRACLLGKELATLLEEHAAASSAAL